MPTRRWPPLLSDARATARVERPMPVADHDVTAAGSASTAATRASAVPGIPPGTPITRSTCTRPPYGAPYRSQQPLQRGDMAEVEELELRHHLALLAELVELGDERPRVREDVVAEVGGAHGQAAGVRLRVEHLAAARSSGSWTLPPVESCTTRSVCLVQRVHRVGEPRQVECWAGARRRGCGRGPSRRRPPRTAAPSRRARRASSAAAGSPPCGSRPRSGATVTSSAFGSGRVGVLMAASCQNSPSRSNPLTRKIYRCVPLCRRVLSAIRSVDGKVRRSDRLARVCWCCSA